MARGRWIYDHETGELVPSDEFHARKAMRQRSKASVLPCPAVIGVMAPVKSMIDGRTYDDKASYYRSVERAGCAIVGYDKNWTDHIKPSYDSKAHEASIAKDVKKAIEQVTAAGGVPSDV